MMILNAACLPLLNIFKTIHGYLSLSLISSAALFCFLGVLASCCCPDTPVCLFTFPLLLACLDSSSVLALAGYCGGFSPASCHLLPLACLTPTAPLLLPEMVVLLRRVTGPLISVLSLISAASVTQFFTCLTLPGEQLTRVSLCFHPWLHTKELSECERAALPSGRVTAGQ